MGHPLRLWVAFGDQVTIFGQHCYIKKFNLLSLIFHWSQADDYYNMIAWSFGAKTVVVTPDGRMCKATTAGVKQSRVSHNGKSASCHHFLLVVPYFSLATDRRLL